MDTKAFPTPALSALEKFPVVFNDQISYAGPLGAAWAPGRVNIIGEHTDYNDGFVLPAAVDRVAAFAGRMRADQTVRLWSQYFEEAAQFSLAGLPETFDAQRADLPGWARYILGVVSELTRDGIPLHGFDAVVGGDVPLGSGMSSSASLEVATAQTCSFFSNGTFSIGNTDATLTPMQVAAVCQRAEHVASGLRSGILDQAASCLGRPGKAVLLDCRSYEYRYIPFDTPGISLMVIDTNVRRELASSGYNERRQQCEEATKLLHDMITPDDPDAAAQVKALRDISPTQFAHYKDRLPEILRKRAGYIIAENERVFQAVAALEKGDIEAVGPILWRGHAGLRDEYQVSCLELDILVDIAHSVDGVLGARMLGGGFGGCTINLVRNEAIEPLRLAVERYYPERSGRQAIIDICRAAGGPGQAVV
ncbi:MAG: galactokinase [Ktedonobacteraceae bacterium]|nr:galactokinase [Ktedonobacteraceae bacterium]